MSFLRSNQQPVSLNGKKNHSIRLLALDGVMSALGVLLMFILRVQLLPAVAPWLIYEMGDVPALITALIAGPVHGILVLLVVSIVQLVTPFSSGIYGLFMHLVSSGLFILIPALLWKFKPKKSSLVIGLVVGTIVMTLAMIPLNLIITPLFTGAPVEAVKQMIVPAIIPFNLTKGALNSVIGFIVFLTLEKVFKISH